VIRDPMRTEQPSGRAPRRRHGARLVLAVSMGALSIGGLLWSCSASNDRPSAIGDTIGTSPTGTANPLDCTVPNAGCACTQPGEMLKCGKVVYKSENYTSCSIGLQTCQPDGTWTDCQGSQVVTLNNAQLGNLRLLAQPAPVAASTNPCDPNLFEINSVLSTDASGITATDGAITLTYGGAGGAVGCGDAAPPPLAVSPVAASLVITQIPTDGAVQPTPNSVQLSANLSGCAGDGSVNAIWTVDQPGVATVSEGGTFSLAYPYAGPIHVTAYAGSLSGTATVNVTINALDTSGVTDGGGLTNAFANTCGLDAGGGG
jgi:hypothetical protein